nr:MAG TPA: hypothetical protein [Caudoviricetes sp.]
MPSLHFTLYAFNTHLSIAFLKFIKNFIRLHQVARRNCLPSEGKIKAVEFCSCSWHMSSLMVSRSSLQRI